MPDCCLQKTCLKSWLIESKKMPRKRNERMTALPEAVLEPFGFFDEGVDVNINIDVDVSIGINDVER